MKKANPVGNDTAQSDQIKQQILFNPKIITNDPEVLLAIGKNLKKDLGKNVVDLRDMAIRKAERQLNELKDQNQIFLEVLSENYDGSMRVIDFILLLIEAGTLEKVFHWLLTKVPKKIGVDYIRLVQLTGNSLPPPLVDIKSRSIKNLTESQFSSFLGDTAEELYKNKISLRTFSVGDDLIYGNVAEQVKSEAIIDLSMDSDLDFTLTFLILGSSNPNKFEPGMETELLEKLGLAFVKIVELFLKR